MAEDSVVFGELVRNVELPLEELEGQLVHLEDKVFVLIEGIFV